MGGSPMGADALLRLAFDPARRATLVAAPSVVRMNDGAGPIRCAGFGSAAWVVSIASVR